MGTNWLAQEMGVMTAHKPDGETGHGGLEQLLYLLILLLFVILLLRVLGVQT